LWCWRRQKGESVGIEDITDAFVKLNRAESAAPDPKAVEVYRVLQALQDQTSRAMRPTFSAHRALIHA
jgi:hypothetical protein